LHHAFKVLITMTKHLLISLLLLFITIAAAAATNWKAKWISSPYSQSQTNTWIGFRTQINIDSVPEKAIANIAVDSKYWLWINNELVVFEGGLKRGPNPNDTYYDEVNIKPYLRKGSNVINIVLWYFGKQGFSHNSSGKAGLLFDCQTSEFNILSDNSWKTMILNAFGTCGSPLPNFRLSESSILYNSDKSLNGFNISGYPDSRFHNAYVIGLYGDAPWNECRHRTIPLFRFSELKSFESVHISGKHSDFDTIFCKLPYNAQFTPYFRLNTGKAGQKIQILTDNYLKYNGGANILRAEYITSTGLQEYENPGWFNGHQSIFVVPKGMTFEDIKYRESGYDADIAGQFSCSDPFFNQLWEKSARTLYLNMRDHYVDCPDRERAQWTGDAVTQSAQVFYCLSPSSYKMTTKWLDEIFNWQRKDDVLFSPSPAGNWNSELPDQSIATIGYYGLWNYYLYSGDKSLISRHYDAAMKYLTLWKKASDGTISIRKGEWNWGDWGDNKDMKLIYNFWYYLALKGMNNIAVELGKTDDSKQMTAQMEELKLVFNKQFWNGTAYRDPAYTGKTDDRVQALAVLCGLVEKEKYEKLMKIFSTEEHASPYMEKYVFEAMVKMGYTREALQRHKKRFGPMVSHPYFSNPFRRLGNWKRRFWRRHRQSFLEWWRTDCACSLHCRHTTCWCWL
jgi:alpha-L-rhamnosidase